tara:strand:+ start:720 stop:1088 length:369 start_codon:yes stop_codon:yes gene_type:complete
MKVKKVEKKVKTSKDEVIKYQILTYCFLNDIQISLSDLLCLTELAKLEKSELTKFCSFISKKEIFKSPQSCRNAITKASKKELIIKTGVNKKIIELNPKIEIQTEGTILLDYKLLGIETKEL